NCFSIWESARSSAFSLSGTPAIDATPAVFAVVNAFELLATRTRYASGTTGTAPRTAPVDNPTPCGQYPYTCTRQEATRRPRQLGQSTPRSTSDESPRTVAAWAVPAASA